MNTDRTMEQWAVVERAVELARNGESFAMATVVWRQGPTSGHQGSRAIVTSTGDIFGWIGGACAEPVLVREAQRVIESGEPALLWLGVDGTSVPDGVTSIAIACQSEGALQIYIEPVLGSPRLIVVGRSPLAHTLETLAQSVGWTVMLVDGPELAGAVVSPTDAVVVATQGHGDEDILVQIAKAGPAYIGVVASARRGDAVRGYLQDNGISAEMLNRVVAPVGLDLGHTTHREVAVSILAQLVQLRASGALRAHRPVQPTAAGTPASGSAGTTVVRVDRLDPVCGMTVVASPTSNPHELDGETYYFCCAGCRTKFAANPSTYLGQGTTC